MDSSRLSNYLTLGVVPVFKFHNSVGEYDEHKCH